MSKIFSMEADLDEDQLIKIASYYSMIVCSSDPKTNSSFHKVLTVFLHKCGVSNTGLEFLHKLGITQCSSDYTNIQNHLASVDEK